MENVCDLQRTGTLKMQGFKRSTRPNLQSLREWLQLVATHPSLIKLPWVPAAEELWQQWLQPAGDPGGLVRQLAQHQARAAVAPWTLAHLEAKLPGVGFARPAVTLWLVERGSGFLQPHHSGDMWGQQGSCPQHPDSAILPSWGSGIQHNPCPSAGMAILRLGQLSANRGAALSS